MVDAATERKDVVPQGGEELLERLRPIGRRTGESGPHLRRSRAPERRHVGSFEPVDQHVDGPVAELAHRLAIDAEGISSH